MAANKFATTLHRSTNRITLILVYAVLEWILIALLLLNSLFSYLIVKFADHFALKRPCLWCSRLDHVFEPRRSDNFPTDLVCEAHAKEISGLEFCHIHRRLADSLDLCEDCCSSSALASETDEWSKRFDFFPWTKQIGVITGKEFLESELELESEEEEEEEISKCSCCGASLSAKRFGFNPCILIKPKSWGISDFPQKKGLVEDDNQTFEADISDQCEEEEEEHGVEVKRLGNEAVEDETTELEVKQAKLEEDYCRFTVSSDRRVSDEQSKEENDEIPTPHLDFVIGEDDSELIPIIENQNQENNDSKLEEEEKEEEKKGANSGIRDVILEFETDSNTRDVTLELVSPAILVSQGTQTDFHLLRQATDADEEEEEEEIDGEISIGTEIPDYEQFESCSNINPREEHEEEEEDPSSTANCFDLHFNCNSFDIVDGEGSESEGEREGSMEEIRAALRAVYAELEEERSAAAVAASQTMAMINRLQEEKAAVQMEAVHYRRVMEEQSDYYHRSLLLFSSDENPSSTPEDAISHHLHHNDHDHDHEDDDHDHDRDGYDEGFLKGHYRHFDCYRGPGKAKRLLPLFDATEENDNVAAEEEEEEEEEFLRRCLEKGDEGLGMLADILRHLRRIRTDEPVVSL